MEEAGRRLSEAIQRIIDLQTELSRLEKIEARFLSQEKLVRNLAEQAASFKSLLQQNTTLNSKVESLKAELSH